MRHSLMCHVPHVMWPATCDRNLSCPGNQTRGCLESGLLRQSIEYVQSKVPAGLPDVCDVPVCQQRVQQLLQDGPAVLQHCCAGTQPGHSGHPGRLAGLVQFPCGLLGPPLRRGDMREPDACIERNANELSEEVCRKAHLVQDGLGGFESLRSGLSVSVSVSHAARGLILCANINNCSSSKQHHIIKQAFITCSSSSLHPVRPQFRFQCERQACWRGAD